MRLLWALCVAVVVSFGCKKESAPTPVAAPAAPKLSPQEVNVDGAYHAVACGAVTAVWAGSAESLKDLPQPAPKAYGVESLSFKFADGTNKGFAPTGQLFFNDWRFDVFSPDCQLIALQQDHFGPYVVVKVEQLRGFLQGQVKGTDVHALSEKDALVHGNLLWVDATHFEFTAECCGGAQAFKANALDGSLERVFDAAQAPKGVRRVNGKYEVVP